MSVRQPVLFNGKNAPVIREVRRFDSANGHQNILCNNLSNHIEDLHVLLRETFPQKGFHPIICIYFYISTTVNAGDILLVCFNFFQSVVCTFFCCEPSYQEEICSHIHKQSPRPCADLSESSCSET